MLALLTAAALALASAFAAPQEDAASATPPPLPIVLWHGMGDTCCDPLTTGGVEKALAKHYGAPPPDSRQLLIAVTIHHGSLAPSIT